jgi:hypothetical protein
VERLRSLVVETPNDEARMKSIFSTTAAFVLLATTARQKKRLSRCRKSRRRAIP